MELEMKQLAFLKAVLGPMSNEEYKERIDENYWRDKEEQRKLHAFVDDDEAYQLFSDIVDYLDNNY